MDGQQNSEAIMGLIMYGGSAKSDAIEAVATAKLEDFELANRKTASTEESLVHAHHSQAGMLAEETKDNNIQVMLLIVHSQDHLMAAIASADLTKEIVDPYRRIDNE